MMLSAVFIILAGVGTTYLLWKPEPQSAEWRNSTDKATISWESTNRITPHQTTLVSRPYNIVLVTVNLLRVDHLSVYGYGRPTTPAMEELAQESFVFSNMFTNADYTMPNMMSIITSLYPPAHGVFDAFKDELSSRISTLGQILKISGYDTSWYALQMPHLDVNVGFGRGYDTIVELQKDYSNVHDITEWIKGRTDSPFFIGINSRSIHPPYIPPPEFKDAFADGGSKGEMASTEEEFNREWYYNILELMETPGSVMDGVISKETIEANPEVFNGEYAARKIFRIQDLMPEDKKIRFGFTHMMTFLAMVDPGNPDNLEYAVSLYDACILGIDQKLVLPILDALKESGHYDDTIIIITGDHGESLGEHLYVGHNNNFYEQLLHVPLIIRYPELDRRVNIGHMAQSVDIMPTLLELIDIKKPFHTQGKSLTPAMEDTGSKPINDFVYGAKRAQAYVRNQDWKLVIDLERDKSEKICKWARLYNIKNDPGERTNLCREETEQLEAMLNELVTHLDTTPKYIDKEYQFIPEIDEKTRKRIKETGYW